MFALKPWGIAPEDIPSPLNFFQNMNIDGKTGKMEHTRVRPEGSESPVILKALMNCLVGVSACPDFLVGGKAVTVEILDSDRSIS
ncbi:MAG: urea carboxylase-associated family protein [Desulfohalobiaceae bacterium]|nr:urea carboxylase-associated family protein [Desulfohalobiaceae bacterium]